MAWHAFFKNHITNVLKKSGITVKVEQEVGKLPLKIDMIIEKKKGNSIEPEYLQTFVKHLSHWNIIELKMLRETVNLAKLTKMLGYFGLFATQESFEPEELLNCSIWILTTQKLKKLFKKIERYWQIKKFAVDGWYKIQFFVPITIIVFNELPVIEEFYPFLLFSSGIKLKTFLKTILSQKDKFFIKLSYFLYKKELIQLAKAQSKAVDDIITLNVRDAVMELGVKNVVDSVGIEAVINAIGIEAVIKSIGVEKLLEKMPFEKVEKFVNKKRRKKNL